jgi:hypothetical protein
VTRSGGRWHRGIVAFAAVLAAGACTRGALPTAPSVLAAVGSAQIHLEGEGGSGQGDVRLRSRASGGLTVHLAPGERRTWTFEVRGGGAYELSITYANGQEGPNETLHVAVDGVAVTSFLDRDSGDAIAGWDTFITDGAGGAQLAPGLHALTIESEGGDGCVEIDFIRVAK